MEHAVRFLFLGRGRAGSAESLALWVAAPVSSQQCLAAPELVIKEGCDRKLEQYPRAILATQSIHSQCLKRGGSCSTVPKNNCQVRVWTQCCWIYTHLSENLEISFYYLCKEGRSRRRQCQPFSRKANACPGNS